MVTTGGINCKFSGAEQREGSYGRIIRANCHQRRELFVLYLTGKSFGRQLQFLVKLRVKEVFVLHVFLTV
jgi:hypothetical protein